MTKREIVLIVLVVVSCLIFAIMGAYFSYAGGTWPVWLGGPRLFASPCECLGGCEEYLRQCYATQTAVVAQQTPPAWWPWGH